MIDIKKAIPHRPPFLFVDKVISIGDRKIVAEKKVSADLDFFKGHYPDFPIMPGVLTCEAVVQAGAILLANEQKDRTGGAPVLTRIKDARFKKMVTPGQTLTLMAEVEDSVGGAFYMKGKATIDGETIMTVKFTCAIASLKEGG